MKLTRLAGCAAAIVYALMTAAAYFMYPTSFDPLHNWLSDLGNPIANPKGAIFYDLGCIMTATLLAFFNVGLRIWRTDNRRKNGLLAIAQIAGLVSSASLILSAIYTIGVFPAVHSFMSMMIFVGFTFFFSFSSASLLSHPHFRKPLAFFGLACAAINFVFGVFFNNVQLGEWIAVATVMVFIVLVDQNSWSLSLNTDKDQQATLVQP